MKKGNKVCYVDVPAPSTRNVNISHYKHAPTKKRNLKKIPSSVKLQIAILHALQTPAATDPADVTSYYC